MKLFTKESLDKFKDLFKPIALPIDVQQQRLRTVERDIILPIKLLLSAILCYYLFFSDVISTITPLRPILLTTIKDFFVCYIILNLLFAGVLIFTDGKFLLQNRWLIFANSTLDAILMSVLTLITGGFESNIFWFLLGLLLRNALINPLAKQQISLNLLVCVLYVAAGLCDIAIKNFEAAYFYTLTEASQKISFPEDNRTNVAGLKNPVLSSTQPDFSRPIEIAPNVVLDENTMRSLDLLPPENPTESFFLRTVLLLLFTGCCYGLQVLLEKNRQIQKEAQEFALRQEKLRAAGRIAAEIAHQIKNPLSIINTSAYMLARELSNASESVKENIRIIKEEVDRSNKIITELMGYAQLAEGKIERLNVVEELERAITIVFPNPQQFNYVINRYYDKEPIYLMMQRGHLAGIFTNILQNAREAMPAGGTIDITVRRDEHLNVVIMIKDYGPGIPPQHIGKIFEPYYTTKSRGTGLGLAIVKQNVETYGGSVKVESESGKGACFIITLPTGLA